MVLRRLELVDAAPDPSVKNSDRKHRYKKCRKNGFGRMMRKRRWMNDHCF